MRRMLPVAAAIGSSLASLTSPHSRADAMTRADRRFLALGDSYTIGEGVDSTQRWPVQLARRLRANGVDVADPEIIARTGWTTDELAAGIAVGAPNGPYALVTLQIGVNNQFRGRDVERYRLEFRSLLAQAIQLAGDSAGRVVVVSIPDWGVTPFAAGHDAAKIGSTIDRFNAANREETARAGARYVDVTARSRERHDGWFAADGLHPSAAQYVRWTDLVLAEATGALGR